MAHKDVLDVTAVPGLRRIEEVDEHWRIGALVDLDGRDPRRLAAALRWACRRQPGRSAVRRFRTARRSPATSAPPRRPATASPISLRSTPRSRSRALAARASSRSKASSTATGTPHAARTRSSRRFASRSPSPAARGSFPEARRAPLPRDLDRDGGRRRRDRCRRSVGHARARRRRLLTGRAPAARSRGAAPRAARVTASAWPSWCRPTHLAELAPIDDIRGRAPPTAIAAAERSFATSSPASERRASGGPPDAPSVPRSPTSSIAVSFTVNGEAALAVAAERRSRRLPISLRDGSA